MGLTLKKTDLIIMEKELITKKESKKTKEVKLKKARSWFNPLDKWIILFGTSYEQRVELMIDSKGCKELAENLMELKQRRARTWTK